jgi:hypothetical protein
LWRFFVEQRSEDFADVARQGVVDLFLEVGEEGIDQQGQFL